MKNTYYELKGLVKQSDGSTDSYRLCFTSDLKAATREYVRNGWKVKDLYSITHERLVK